MKRGEILSWNGREVAIMDIDGPKILVKAIKNPGKGNVFEVDFKELKEKKTMPKMLPSPNGCPECGLSAWNYRSGVECPACHYKESFNFRKYLGQLEKN